MMNLIIFSLSNLQSLKHLLSARCNQKPAIKSIEPIGNIEGNNSIGLVGAIQLTATVFIGFIWTIDLAIAITFLFNADFRICFAAKKANRALNFMVGPSLSGSTKKWSAKQAN